MSDFKIVCLQLLQNISLLRIWVQIPGKHHGSSRTHMGSHSGLARVPWMARLWGGIGGLCVAGLGGPTGRQGVTGAEDTDREGRSLGRGGVGH